MTVIVFTEVSPILFCLTTIDSLSPPVKFPEKLPIGNVTNRCGNKKQNAKPSIIMDASLNEYITHKKNSAVFPMDRVRLRPSFAKTF